MKNSFLVVIGCLLSACMMPLQPSPHIPETAVFQEGDIVVIADGGLESWFLALAARENIDTVKTPFSHSEMVFRNSDNELMIGGVFNGQTNAEPLRKRFEKFHRAAVFRSRASEEKREEAALILRQSLNDPRLRGADFDYSMSYKPGSTDKLFCAGIINDAYTKAGLSAPFGRRRWHENGLTRHVEEIIGSRLTSLVDLNSIYRAGDYSLVLEWQNDQINREHGELSRKIVLYLLDQYDKGLRLKASEQFHLYLDFADLSETARRLGRLRITLAQLQEDIFTTWDLLESRGRLEGLNQDEQDALLAAVLEKYNEKYFYRADAADVSDQQLHAAALSR